MNDDELASTKENQPNTEESEPLLPQNEAEAEEGAEEASDKKSPDAPPCALGTPALSQDPLPDPNPSAPAASAEAEKSELEQLRGELSELRAALTKQGAWFEDVNRDTAEFQELYPNVPISEIGDRVWEDVKRGIPLAAAYALAEKRRTMIRARAAESNAENRKRSSGALDSTENNFFSLEEVRKMSQDEVRTNYQKILSSMRKWNR